MHAAKKENGVVMVEFALVLPLFAFLIIGTMWFGLALNYWIDETHLTREAARYAAVNFNPGPSDTLQASIQQQADTCALRLGGPACNSSITDAPAQVCIDFPPNQANGSIGQVGDPVEATMSVDFNFIPFLSDGVLPWVGGIGVDNVTITSRATMRLEALATNYAAGCTS